MPRTILVTGANGYIGQHVIKKLLLLCPDDTVVAADLKNDNIDRQAVYVSPDILREAAVRTFTTGLEDRMSAFILPGRTASIIMPKAT